MALENDNVIELNDLFYDLLITRMCDWEVYGNANENIIEMKEKDAEEVENLNLNTRPKRKSRAPSRHADVMKWNSITFNYYYVCNIYCDLVTSWGYSFVNTCECIL